MREGGGKGGFPSDPIFESVDELSEGSHSPIPLSSFLHSKTPSASKISTLISTGRLDTFVCISDIVTGNVEEVVEKEERGEVWFSEGSVEIAETIVSP